MKKIIAFSAAINFFLACKNTAQPVTQPDKSGKATNASVDDVVNQPEAITNKDSGSKTQASDSGQSPSSQQPNSDFAFTIEMPKETYTAASPLPFVTTGTTLDNSCPYFAGMKQNGNKLILPFTNLGGTLPGAELESAANSFGSAPNPSISCFVWGRIKNVPAGYRVAVKFSDNSSLKAQVKMKKYVAPATPTPYKGDQGRIRFSGLVFSDDSASMRPVYSNKIDLSKMIQLPSDIVDDTVTTEFRISEFTPDYSSTVSSEACPTATHEAKFYFYSFNPGVVAYKSDPDPVIPNAMFDHKFYIKELPELTFSLVKCN
jgi:hypothetical protein